MQNFLTPQCEKSSFRKSKAGSHTNVGVASASSSASPYGGTAASLHNVPHGVILASIIIFLSVSVIDSADAQTRAECLAKTENLREILLSVSKKMTALPPLVKIFVALKGSYSEALLRAERNEFVECLTIAEVAITQGTPYK